MAGKELSRKPKEIRDRLRRGTDRKRDLELMGYKPVPEWDMEELARGRPRNSNGSFRGASPSWLTEDIRAEALKRLKDNVFSELMALVPLAAKTVRDTLTSTEVDDNGRPVVDAKTKLDAAKWLSEHAVGKATQRTTVEVNPVNETARILSRIQIVNDDGKSDYWLDHMPPDYIDGEVADDEDDSPFEMVPDQDD